MKQRKANTDTLRSALIWEHTAKCSDCDRHFGPTPGFADIKKVQFICQKCGKEMTITNKQVRSTEEANLILRNRHLTEKCVCGTTNNHHVVKDEDGDYWLICGTCGEEIREVDKEEINGFSKD